MKKIKDIMSPSVCLLSESNSLGDAAKLMGDQRLSCVLVCDEGKPKGILTERDVVRVFAANIGNPDIASMNVEAIMTREPICIDENMAILDALVLARSRKVRHLPVVDDCHELVGIVTQTDTINAYVKSFEKNKELSQSYEALKLLSLDDPLVGAGNRRALDVDLKHMNASAKRYGKPYAVAMIDIDYFKRYNDCYGHQKGDETLISVVEIIKKTMRDSDRVYRYGGEEFLLLMQNTNAEQSLIVGERIRKAVQDSAIEHNKSDFGVVTVSVGLSENIGQPEEVVEQADQALYKAKNNGRNQISH